MTAPATGWGASASPFKFLDYFAEVESSRFHGRKRETADMTSLVTAERTVVLYGRSGVGKTSLLLAGVFPELRRRGFFPVQVRLLRDPLPDLIEAVARAAGTPPGETLAATLERAAAAKGPLVVVLDQLEELFVRFPRAEDRAPVLDEIASALSNDSARVRFVFSLRQDYMADLDGLEGPLEGLLDRRYRLRGLTSAGAREAIARALYNADVEFSQKLLNRLVDLLKVDAFDSAVLRIICSELCWQAERNHPERLELDEKDLDDTGGRDAIFRRYLDRAVASVPRTDHFLLRGILSGLVTSHGTKKATTIRQLGERERFLAGAWEIRRTLKHLARAHVVRVERRGHETWFELIHERLVDVIEPWLAEDPRFFSFRFASDLIERLAGNPIWRDNPSALVAGSQLDALIGPCKEHLRLQSAEEAELLLRSAVYARSGDIAFWEGACSPEATRALIGALLEHGDAEVRRTAALATTKLWRIQAPAGIAKERALEKAPAEEAPPEPDAELVSALLGVALGDEDSSVRSVAAQAFAAFGRAGATDPVREALERTDEEDGPRREAAMEVVIAWIPAGAAHRW